MAQITKQNAGLEPTDHILIYRKPPITSRISYFLKVWSLKIVNTLVFLVIRFLKPIPREQRPTIIRAYSCRPHLRNRIFIPRSYKTGELLPLYLDAHGGGHTLCDAEFDDTFCSTFANQFNVLVVSIEYTRAPRSKFPGPTNDVVAIAQAIIEDEALPVDKSRVVFGGFSAGGNLALSAAQTPALKDKIHGIVSWYPCTDYSLTAAEKQSSRPYRTAKDTDDLKDWPPIFSWAYIRPGQNIRDPLLSVRYAKRENLPSWIYMIGAEYDMLANEARQTIFDIANLDKLEREDGIYEFEKDTYRWTLVRGIRHGFTHDMMDDRGADAKAMDKKRTEEMLEEVGKWLFKGPFAK
jgi:acetyl esterase/lipase